MILKSATKIEVRSSDLHGYGVFAIEPIKEKEIIEECHLITVNDTPLNSTTLLDYRFFYPQLGPEWRKNLIKEMKSRGKDKVEIVIDFPDGHQEKVIHPDETYVIPLGNGCIYNHSEDNNATWQNHPECKAFQFIATKDIKVGEEICTSYGKTYFLSKEGTGDWEGRERKLGRQKPIPLTVKLP